MKSFTFFVMYTFRKFFSRKRGCDAFKAHLTVKMA